jgi:hypothetical protein
MTFNDVPQLVNGAGMVILFQMPNRINDSLHFLPEDFEENLFFIGKEVIDIGRSTTIGNGYFAHARGIVAFFPEKPPRGFQHLRLLKTGFHSVSIHLEQTVLKGFEGRFINERPLIYCIDQGLVK